LTKEAIRTATLAVGRHVIEVRADLSYAPSSMVVSVTLDGRRSWQFDEPGWRELAYGVYPEGGVAYWWSARDVVVMPTDEHADPRVIAADEDILFAFAVANGWLLVCETSIRLLVEDHEVSRIEAGEVFLSARWDESTLLVVDDSGGEWNIRISDGRLVS
jgi:hypothetical protein